MFARSMARRVMEARPSHEIVYKSMTMLFIAFLEVEHGTDGDAGAIHDDEPLGYEQPQDLR